MLVSVGADPAALADLGLHRQLRLRQRRAVRVGAAQHALRRLRQPAPHLPPQLGVHLVLDPLQLAEEDSLVLDLVRPLRVAVAHVDAAHALLELRKLFVQVERELLPLRLDEELSESCDRTWETSSALACSR